MAGIAHAGGVAIPAKGGRAVEVLLRFLPTEVLHPISRIQIVSLGTAVLFLAAFFLPVAWLLLSGFPPDILLILAKSSAFLAIYLLSVNFILSTRWRLLERAFGGLDRMYKVHKVVGKLALIFVFLHPIFLTIRAIPSWDIVAVYLVPGLDAGITGGILSLVVLFILVLLTVQPRLPYHMWHNTHRLMVVPLVLALAHAVMSGSAMAEYPLIRYPIIALASVGVFCSAYTAFLYRRVGPRHHGRVGEVRRMGDITELRLEVRGMSFHPGQFIFVRFLKLHEKEMFPFSISGYDGGLRISVKRSGDFTSEKLPNIEKGEEVVVMGPYGRFGERYLAHRKDVVWVAGGIGITPFLSMAKHESEHPVDRRITLIWSVSRVEEAHYFGELEYMSAGRPGFDFTLWISRERGRIRAVDIAHLAGKDALLGALIFLCGPPAMMDDLADQLMDLGVRRQDIVYEDFELL